MKESQKNKSRAGHELWPALDILHEWSENRNSYEALVCYDVLGSFVVWPRHSSSCCCRQIHKMMMTARPMRKSNWRRGRAALPFALFPCCLKVGAGGRCRFLQHQLEECIVLFCVLKKNVYLCLEKRKT